MKGIVVLDYDPTWPAEFDRIREKFQSLLGDVVLEIVHIGSTSIPGLCAKPKIDVDIVLNSEADIPDAIEQVKAGGYTFHGDKYQDGMWAFTIGRGSFGERIYLCAPGTKTHEDRLLFRDYLRVHAEAAEAYGRLKCRLASEASNDWDYYTRNKGPFVADIVRLAREASRAA